jgi:hypothetical protein
MSDEVAVVPGSKGERGEYRKSVTPLIERALQALASGACRSISAAASEVGMSRRGLTAALRKNHVRGRMRELIEENLKAGSLRASTRVREIMEQESNPIAALNASRYLLATGHGIVPPSPPSTAVSINVSQQTIGYVIRLKTPPEPADPVTIEHERAEQPVTIEHDPVEGDRAK